MSTALMQAAGVGINLAGIIRRMQDERNRPGALSPQDIAGYMQPAQDIANQMQTGVGRLSGIGEDLMDPTSTLNQQQQQMLQEQAANQASMQALLNRRQAAAMGQASGITAAQNRTTQAQMARGARQQSLEQQMRNRMSGIGVLGQAQGLLGRLGAFQQGLSENLAQAALAQRQQEMGQYDRMSTLRQGMYSGVSEGLLGYAGQGAGGGELTAEQKLQFIQSMFGGG